MEFDLQRFSEGDEQPASSEQQPTAESSAEEQAPIPKELDGIPEDIARETMAEFEQSKTQEDTQAPPAPPESVSREEYQAKVEEANQLKAQLAEYQRRQQQAQQPQQPQFQPQQLRITPEVSDKINQAIKAEAMALTGMSDDDVASLDYADDDDPRLSQWAQAKSIAQNRVYGAIQQAQIQQAQQAQQFYNNHMAAIRTYNEFAAKEFAEPDFKEIQNFATNEFFTQLPPNEQKIIANAYVRIERQIASPAEMMVVKNYFGQAKAAYRARGVKQPPRTQMQQPVMPRTDQLRGSAGKGEVTVGELERMLETTDFDKIPEVYQKKLLGY